MKFNIEFFIVLNKIRFNINNILLFNNNNILELITFILKK